MASETVKIGTPEWYQLVVCGLRQLKTHMTGPFVPEWKGKQDALRWIDAILKGKAEVLEDRRRQERRKTDRRREGLTVEEARHLALEMLEEAEALPMDDGAGPDCGADTEEEEEDEAELPYIPAVSTPIICNAPRHVRVFTDDDLVGGC